MEEEIDLRAYVSALLRRWYLVLGLTVTGIIVGVVISFLSPAQYQATAVVVVTQARYQLQFDPRVETSSTLLPAYKAFPRLATSDSVLQAVVDGYRPTPNARLDNWNLGSLSTMVEASSEGDPSLVVLAVRSRSPEDATAIANLWADSLVAQGNEIYGQSQQDVSFFEAQVDQAEKALNDADAALIAFQARNDSSILGGQLDSQRKAQAELLASQRSINQMMQDVQSLRGQLQAQPAGQASSFGDSLTALLLQVRAFNNTVTSSNTATSPGQPEVRTDTATTPIQLQVSTDTALSNKSLSEQVAFLDSLAAALQEKSAKIDAQLNELEPTILSLQQKLQEVTAESDRLTNAQDLAQATYLTMARKLDEARIGAQEQDKVLQVGSHAAVPATPASPRKLLNTSIAGLVGLMSGVLCAFAAEWWFGKATA